MKPDAGNEIAEEIIRDYQRLAGARGNWESHWQEIAQRADPSNWKNFKSGGHGTKGDKRNEYVFDSTASIALQRFMAILDSLITPRVQRYQKLSTDHPTLNKDRQVKLYFEQATDALFKYRYAPKANFTSQNQQIYRGLGAYGTGCLFTDEVMGEIGMRYRAHHLGEIYISENHQGVIDKVLRYFPLSARKAFKLWGNSLPESIIAKLKDNPENEFFFIHCVKPKDEYDSERLDYKGMPFSSHYVSMEGKKLLKESGYNTFPYSVPRYEQAVGEEYGRSPLMHALPAIKTLNEMAKTVLKQGHRALDPIYLMHDDGIMDTFSAKPGAMVAGGVSADGHPLVQTLQTGNIAVSKELMDDQRAPINDACLVSLFQILMERPQMTATEVVEIAREKGILVAPTLGRVQDEHLGSVTEREIDILSRQGVLPPMPQALREANGEYKIIYDSPLSRSQRMEEVSGYMRSIEMSIRLAEATQDPSHLYHYNFNMIIPEVNEINGMPIRWMNDPKVVQQMRDQQSESQQTEQMINAAPGAAAMISSAAKMKAVGG